MRQTGRIIAIDGPAGSGKSSAARLLAKRLGYLYLDSGALYRAVGWKALQEGVDVQDAGAIRELCARLDLALKPTGEEENMMAVCVDGRDVMPEIRVPEISRAAAAVAVMPSVRERLLGIQREIANQGEPGGGAVIEGRDIGTVVFPNAHIKFFLEAASEVRINRRVQELKSQGLSVDAAETRTDINTRDLKDSSRSIAPLRPAEDAIRIDSTDLSLDKVVEAMLKAIQDRNGPVI